MIMLKNKRDFTMTSSINSSYKIFIFFFIFIFPNLSVVHVKISGQARSLAQENLILSYLKVGRILFES